MSNTSRIFFTAASRGDLSAEQSTSNSHTKSKSTSSVSTTGVSSGKSCTSVSQLVDEVKRRALSAYRKKISRQETDNLSDAKTKTPAASASDLACAADAKFSKENRLDLQFQESENKTMNKTETGECHDIDHFFY